MALPLVKTTFCRLSNEVKAGILSLVVCSANWPFSHLSVGAPSPGYETSFHAVGVCMLVQYLCHETA